MDYPVIMELFLGGGICFLGAWLAWLMVVTRARGSGPSHDALNLSGGILALVALIRGGDLVARYLIGDLGSGYFDRLSYDVVQFHVFNVVVLGGLGVVIHRFRRLLLNADGVNESRNIGDGRASDAEFERRRMEDFATAASDWFWETDAEHRYTWFSERVEDYTDFPREWHYGKTREELGVPDISREAWKAHLDDLRNHRPYRNFDYSR